MRKILDQNDYVEMSLQKKSILFLNVDWSIYANKLGFEEIENAEKKLLELSFDISFWSADVSNVNSSGNFIFEILRQQETNYLEFFPNSATGNGAVFWFKNGKIVDWAFSAWLLKTNKIIELTLKHFD